MQVFDPNNAQLLKEKMAKAGLDTDGWDPLIRETLSTASPGLSFPKTDLLRPRKLDTEHYLGGDNHSNYDPQFHSTVVYRGEMPLDIKEGNHSRMGTVNLNDFMEGSISVRSANVGDVTSMFGGSNFASENIQLGASAKF